MNKFYEFIEQKKTTPRWLILILDLCICCFSIVYANFLRFNFNADLIERGHMALQLSTTFIVNATFFIVFRTYVGIIRISGFKEALRCIAAVFYSFFFLSVCNIFSSIFDWQNLVPTSILIIYFFTASFLIFGYRIMVKNLYKRSVVVKRVKEQVNVVIFGSELNGSLLKRTIEQLSNNEYNVVAFVEDEARLLGKSIDNVKIYSFSQIKHVVKAWDIKMFFFAKENFNIDLKNQIVDYGLNNNITVKVIPPINEWLHGQLTIKQIKEVKIEDLLNRPQIKLTNDHISTYLKDKHVLITGAAGSIGSEIARQVSAIDPAYLILCDQSESALYELEYELQQKHGIRSNIKFFIGDVRDRKAMQGLFLETFPQVVFHAAAYKHVPLMEKHPCEAIRNNVLGTKVMADLSQKFGVERFVFVSTDKAINPTNVMGASKRVAEMYVESLQSRQFNISVDADGNIDLPALNKTKTFTRFITTRFGNVLGSNGSVIPRFKEQIDKGGPVTVTHPDIIRYFMTIPEACSLVLEAGTMGEGGEIFIFDMGEPVKIVDLATKMIKLAGLTPGKDIKIEFSGLRPGEKLFEELLNNQEQVIPTHHKKIMKAKSSKQDSEFVNINIEQLIELALGNNELNVVRQMKKIVPEYKSKNSRFEALDNEKETSSIQSIGEED
jgi:FlaA1/EpsC-like NDP-sugar epimerase